MAVIVDDGEVHLPGFYAMTFRILAASALVFTFAGCNSSASLTPEQQAGQFFFKDRCAHCHVDNDLALKPAPPDLHNLFSRSTLPSGAPATDSQVIHTIVGGKGKMPAFAGRFTGQQLNDVVAYLRAGIR